ncbi:uncharacterized protein TNCV_860951 [Trichonephila clavipes]|nr:uncharacterized protein TNCV_860951 [Trichonephila clavipes]
MYRKDIDKVELHMHKTFSHMSKSTTAYLAKKESETGIKCIPFDEVRVKSPYASAMDFCVLGLLKRALGKRYTRTMNGLWKTVQEEWSKICMTVLRKNLLSRKTQARAIVKNHGYQIEEKCHKKNTEHRIERIREPLKKN